MFVDFMQLPLINIFVMDKSWILIKLCKKCFSFTIGAYILHSIAISRFVGYPSGKCNPNMGVICCKSMNYLNS